MSKDWKAEAKQLWRQIKKIQRDHPPIYKGAEWVTTSFDGSFCAPWLWRKYEYPADPIVDDLLRKELYKVRELQRKETVKAYSEPCNCSGKGFGED